MSLMLFAGQGNYSALADGFAVALQESLADPRQQTPLHASPSGEALDPSKEGNEDSATLILGLLIRAAFRPGPNLAHLLLGFDVTDGLQGIAMMLFNPVPDDCHLEVVCIGQLGLKQGHCPCQISTCLNLNIGDGFSLFCYLSCSHALHG